VATARLEAGCSLPPFTLSKAQERSKNVLHREPASPVALGGWKTFLQSRAEISIGQEAHIAQYHPALQLELGKDPTPQPQ